MRDGAGKAHWDSRTRIAFADLRDYQTPQRGRRPA